MRGGSVATPRHATPYLLRYCLLQGKVHSMDHTKGTLTLQDGVYAMINVHHVFSVADSVRLCSVHSCGFWHGGPSSAGPRHPQS